MVKQDNDVAVREHIASLDRAVDTAVSTEDEDTLRQILAEDFVYTHSTEHSDARDGFIAWMHRPREDRPPRLLSDVQVELHDDVAVSRGNLDIVYVDGSRKLLRYVRVYRQSGGEWRVISSRTALADDRKDSAAS